MNAEGEAKADSAKAHRILKACAGSLDFDDIASVVDLLKDGGMFSNHDADQMKSSLDPSKSEPDSEMAADAAFYTRFPHANRLRGSVTFNGRPPSHGDNPRSRADMDTWLARTFPNQNRLKA